MTSHSADYPRHATPEPVSDKADMTADRSTDAGKRAQEMASNAAELARQYAEKAQNAARQFKPFVEKSLKEQPMSTLAGAAAIGFLLGALWKR